MDHTFANKRTLRFHMLIMHHCDLVTDPSSGKDCLIPMAGECAHIIFTGEITRKEHALYCHLQQPWKDVAAYGTVSTVCHCRRCCCPGLLVYNQVSTAVRHCLYMNLQLCCLYVLKN